MSNISQVSINQTSSDPGKPPQQARQVFHPRYSPHPPHFSFLPFLFSRSFIPSFITLSLLSFFFFNLYSSLPWNFLAFLLYSPVLPFYTISSLFFASLCSSFTLHVFKSCVSVSPLTFPYFPLCFLHSPPGGSHFR